MKPEASKQEKIQFPQNTNSSVTQNSKQHRNMSGCKTTRSPGQKWFLYSLMFDRVWFYLFESLQHVIKTSNLPSVTTRCEQIWKLRWAQLKRSTHKYIRFEPLFFPPSERVWRLKKRTTDSEIPPTHKHPPNTQIQQFQHQVHQHMCSEIL